ncbi:hypothetical protein VUR80DRAFT_1574 [Thermomyces stellatus]
MGPSSVLPFSRWASWVVSRTARQTTAFQGKWANTLQATLSLASRGLASLPGSQKQNQRVSVVRDWTHERGKYQGKAYPCNVTIFPENRVWLGYVTFRLPRHRHFCNDRVDVYIEFSPPGTRHPKCFAVKAQPDDPASRLALRVRGEVLDEGPYNDYVHSVGKSIVFKANALADMLLDTASREEIMQRPRRSWETKSRPPRRRKSAVNDT